MRIRKISAIVLAAVMVLSFAGCNKTALKVIDSSGSGIGTGAEESGTGFRPGEGYKSDIHYSAIDGEGVYEGEFIPSTNGEEEPAEEPVIPAGQITSSAYFDNDHFEFWKELISKGQETDGAFYGYRELAFNTKNRIKLTFPKEYYVTVSLTDGKYSAVADRQGVAYLFPPYETDEYEIRITYKYGAQDTGTFTDTVAGDKAYSADDFNAFTVNTNVSDKIDIMFVVDTTGSMGDEIDYLKAEIADVITRVKEANQNADVHLALLFYRDEGDDYLTRYFDFTTDIDKQKANISAQEAGGGGDFEEAVHTALALASSKQWRTDATKILVHVADAPAHDKDITSWNDTVKELAGSGIRVITVASSGIDKKTEYLFRCQSMMTGGVYTYLTNDSGIGGDHIEATTEGKMEVEFLNLMLARLINGLHTGIFAEAINYKQVQ